MASHASHLGRPTPEGERRALAGKPFLSSDAGRWSGGGLVEIATRLSAFARPTGWAFSFPCAAKRQIEVTDLSIAIILGSDNQIACIGSTKRHELPELLNGTSSQIQCTPRQSIGTKVFEPEVNLTDRVGRIFFDYPINDVSWVIPKTATLAPKIHSFAQQCYSPLVESLTRKEVTAARQRRKSRSGKP